MRMLYHKSFKKPIQNRTKLHTIRTDRSAKWQPGRIINHAVDLGNDDCEYFQSDICVSTQVVEINWGSHPIKGKVLSIIIDGNILKADNILQFLKNDGITIKQFQQRFPKSCVKKLIHWTDLKY